MPSSRRPATAGIRRTRGSERQISCARTIRIADFMESHAAARRPHRKTPLARLLQFSKVDRQSDDPNLKIRSPPVCPPPPGRPDHPSRTGVTSSPHCPARSRTPRRGFHFCTTSIGRIEELPPCRAMHHAPITAHGFHGTRTLRRRRRSGPRPGNGRLPSCCRC